MTTFKLANTYPAKKKDKKMEQDNKPKRKRITSEQLQSLTELFQETETPTFDLRESLAKKLNMTNREVQVWFQNRRAKANRIKQQQQGNNKFTYWSTSSSMNSSSSSSPLLLPNELFINTQSPIDILATAAAYIQDMDQQQKKRKLEEEQESTVPKKKSWRPWL